MPDLTPDEADRCPHCGAGLRNPPHCCDEMIAEHAEAFRKGRDTTGYSFNYDDPYYDLIHDEPFYPNEFDGDSD